MNFISNSKKSGASHKTHVVKVVRILHKASEPVSVEVLDHEIVERPVADTRLAPCRLQLVEDLPAVLLAALAAAVARAGVGIRIREVRGGKDWNM